ncbi:MAG: precorrin-6A reductase [Lachnospiraceae bacterium]|nr:precorrin-6A reductase [Lachnospiraceae bacterium]
MKNVILFAGTTEGRETADALRGRDLSVTVCVATDYGRDMIEESGNVKVLMGRLDKNDMVSLFKEKAADIILDATHPYAKEVTENVKAAAAECKVKLLRVLREDNTEGAALPASLKAKYFDSNEEVLKFLDETEGSILFTTGSKELKVFKDLKDFPERAFVRILPAKESLDLAFDAGLDGKHIICMHGPFSREINREMLKSTGAKFLVTKETGVTGGYLEKLLSCDDLGVTALIIKKPAQDEGMTVNECIKLLTGEDAAAGENTVKPEDKKITILGIGTGDDTLTKETIDAVKNAGLLIGAKRIADTFDAPHARIEYEYLSEKIAEIIANASETNIAVAMSGDTGFYSGTKKLLPLLSDYDVTVLPAISSVIAFAAKLKTSWDDAVILSAHGKDLNIIHYVKHNKKVITIVGNSGAKDIIAELNEYGFSDVKVSVGEKLSYPDEKITVDTAANLLGKDFDTLSVMMIENDSAGSEVFTPGFDDSLFLRAEVPMTKQEIRSVTLSKLNVKRDSICFDIGAGTGSVSLEMAEIAFDGKVYAIEHKKEACDLIEKNKRHLKISNIEVIEADAPDGLSELPDPTHVFIGGSSGRLIEIVKTVLEKNPDVRIVINAVTAESIAESVNCVNELKLKNIDIVQLSAARGRALGRYHLMTAINPIFIISADGCVTE